MTAIDERRKAKMLELHNMLVAAGWSADRFGHFKKQFGPKLYRIKRQTYTLRVERQFVTESQKSWLRLGTCQVLAVDAVLWADKQALRFDTVLVDVELEVLGGGLRAPIIIRGQK